MAAGLLALVLLARAPTEKGPDDYDRYLAARDLQAGLKKIERTALGMTKNHALEFKRVSRAALIKKLATKLHMSEKDVADSPRWLKEQQRAADAARAREEAKKRAIADRPNRNVAGVVGMLVVPSTYGTDYFVYCEAAILFVARDTDGLAKMVREKKLAVSEVPLRVRVIERYDYRKLGKGLFVRARILDDGYDGAQIFCIPENIASE